MSSLYEKFLVSALDDIDAENDLKTKYNPLAFYHLEQAFEKIIKAYHIFNSIKALGKSESDAYNKIKRYGHKIDESTFQLL